MTTSETRTPEIDPDDATDRSLAAVPERSALDVATTRAAQEVQAAMVVAKRFPRDEEASYRRILKACQRVSLAGQASYMFPRGGSKVTGPSIRLAEVLAQSWGNFESGVVELERKRGESVAMAYAWDLETNSRDVKVFTVRHWRDTESGGYALESERDIYECVANQGARRKRACILALIPGDVVESAEDECEKTLAGQNKTPLSDRVRDMLVDFDKLGVTKEMIEARLGFKTESIGEAHLIGFKKIHQSLKDGMATRGDFFKPPKAAAGPAPTTLADVGEALAKKVAPPVADETLPDPKSDAGKKLSLELDAEAGS